MIRGSSLVTALLLVSACSHQQQAAESTPTPRVGDCYVKVSGPPVNCATRHIAQTVFVNMQPVKNEARAMVPCREAQARFLGQDFNTRLDLQLWVASDKSWYRCDVLLRNSTRGFTDYQALTGSLQGVLRKGVGIDLQVCLGTPYDPSVDQPYVSCGQPHVAQEMSAAPAIGTLAEKFPADIANRAVSVCYATASSAGLLGRGRSVTAYYPRNAAAWASGERTADCWVTATSGTLPPVTPNPR
jgi:Septum formation